MIDIATIPTEINLIIPAVLIALNGGLKKYFDMPSKYAILINWVGGIALNVSFLYPFADSYSFTMAILTGFLLGCSAGGIYDGGKAGVNAIKENLE